MGGPAPPKIGPDEGVTVSVAMTTYNQEKFIEQAIDSALGQETTFPVELVIGEDCSVDRTRAIVLDYGRRFPNKVRLLLHERNVGPQHNLAQTLQACRGRYIALLEGDDYWTSRHKLQKQVDFLERHPECSQCFHAAAAFCGDGSSAPYVKEPPEGMRRTSTLEDLLHGNYMTFCSVMFRRGLVARLPECYYRLLLVDWLLFVLQAEHGRIGYLDEVMAVYRVHSGGVWSGLNWTGRQKAILDFYDAVRPYLGRRFGRVIRCGTFLCCYELAMAYTESGDFLTAKTYARKGLKQRPFDSWHCGGRAVGLLLKLSVPPVYRLLRSAVRGLRAFL
jgi:glycosyltransferase involved in cell wall biosynthesis